MKPYFRLEHTDGATFLCLGGDLPVPPKPAPKRKPKLVTCRELSPRKQRCQLKLGHRGKHLRVGRDGESVGWVGKKEAK